MTDLLRSLWREPRPPDPPPRQWWDWVMVAALMAAAALEGALRPDLPWRVGSVIIVAGLAPTLLWRRTHPLLSVAIFMGSCAVVPPFIGAELQLYTVSYGLLLWFALARWGSGREVGLGALIILAKLGLSAGLGHLSLGDTIGGLVVLAATVAVGAALRYRARARMREIAQVKLLERERLARDLHDTVAHHVSAMAIRAQAGLATLETHPDAAADALRLIEAEASRTLAEMRTLVRALRRDQPAELATGLPAELAAELAPSPRLADLARLTGEPREGPAIEVAVAGDLDGIPPTVGAAIYRLAQESVTNARRHARHATRIMVRVTADDTSIRLRVSDDGDPSVRTAAAAPGYGLIGMTERAGLLGGTLSAGPNPDRGWSVTAVLPRAGAAARAAAA